MNVSILQYNIKWMDPQSNIDFIAKYLEKTEFEVELLVLPEMFLTGFNMNAEKAAISEFCGYTEQLIEQAKKHNTALIGSLAIKEDDRYYNRMLLITEDGIIARYDKQYLFSPSGEDKVYDSKYPARVIEYNGWNILTQVCYDLRFPENVRNLEAPDLLIYAANWPSPRLSHWDALLVARAIENQCFTIGCNRIGKDNNGWEFTGHSQLIKPDGALVTLLSSQDALELELSKEVVSRYRNKYPFLNDKKSGVQNPNLPSMD